MPMILKNGNYLEIGKDFVDAAYLNPVTCGGTIRVRTRNIEHTMYWQSTLTIADTEHVIRTAAKQNGATITMFTSFAS